MKKNHIQIKKYNRDLIEIPTKHLVKKITNQKPKTYTSSSFKALCSFLI